MIRPGRLGVLAGASLTCSVFASSAVAFAARSTAPYSVRLNVVWSQKAGSDAFRGDLSRALAQALSSRCFSRIDLDGAETSDAVAELTFRVVLSNAVEETRFDDSLANALQPGEPSQELRKVIDVEVTVDAELTTTAAGALMARKHLVSRVTRRPVYVGEDPRESARAEAIDNIVRDLIRALGCGSEKLNRKLRAALGDRDPEGARAR